MKIALSGLFYPVAILRYFESALEAREDVELVTVGPYTENWIPWAGGMLLPDKYAKQPTKPLNKQMIGAGMISPDFLTEDERFKDVDIWIQGDAGFTFTTPPPADVVVHIATDPHAIRKEFYDVGRNNADFFFNMQRCYSQPGDIYMPYCASRYHHFPEEREKTTDVCLVGLQYPNRNNLVQALRAQGISVDFRLGLGPDEYREAYNRSRVAISWSSLDDLIARVFEAGAMKLPLVTNSVPDLAEHFSLGKDLLNFGSDVSTAVRMVKTILEQENDAEIMAESMYKKVMDHHTYDHRIQQILDVVGA